LLPVAKEEVGPREECNLDISHLQNAHAHPLFDESHVSFRSSSAVPLYAAKHIADGIQAGEDRTWLADKLRRDAADATHRTQLPAAGKCEQDSREMHVADRIADGHADCMNGGLIGIGNKHIKPEQEVAPKGISAHGGLASAARRHSLTWDPKNHRDKLPTNSQGPRLIAPSSFSRFSAKVGGTSFTRVAPDPLKTDALTASSAVEDRQGRASGILKIPEEPSPEADQQAGFQRMGEEIMAHYLVVDPAPSDQQLVGVPDARLSTSDFQSMPTRSGSASLLGVPGPGKQLSSRTK
jgi:hypothetical protein